MQNESAISPSLKISLGRSLAFAVLASFFISATQFYFKIGSLDVDLSHPWTLFLSLRIWLGVFFYLVAFYWTMKAYQYGEISVVLPVLSLCDVWNVCLAVLVLHEPLTGFRALGTLLILTGIVVVSR